MGNRLELFPSQPYSRPRPCVAVSERKNLLGMRQQLPVGPQRETSPVKNVSVVPQDEPEQRRAPKKSHNGLLREVSLSQARKTCQILSRTRRVAWSMSSTSKREPARRALCCRGPGTFTRSVPVKAGEAPPRELVQGFPAKALARTLAAILEKASAALALSQVQHYPSNAGVGGRLGKYLFAQPEQCL